MNPTDEIKHIEARLLKTLVPVNSLTEDHLYTLLRDQSVEFIFSGQNLFSIGCCDKQLVYLLSGEVELIDETGMSVVVSSEDLICHHPLVDYQPRRHNAVAQTDCSIIRFNSEQLDAMLAWDQASSCIMADIAAQRDLDEDADWMLTLLKSNLFYKVPPMNIREILNKFEPQYVSSGDTVIRQGELGNCCYYIKEGLAGVYQSDDDRSSSMLVAELGVGRCFGEDALINREARNATIKMHSNGVLMRLDKQDFYLLLKQQKINCLNLMQAQDIVIHGGCWIDVRTQDEFEKGHHPMAINIPLNLIKLKSRMLDKNKHYVVYCNSGRRSSVATYLLKQDGFNVSLLQDGFCRYSKQDQLLFEQAGGVSESLL